MCGITGFNWEDKLLGETMNDCLSYRGPDTSGVFAEEGMTLAHRRLSIIDLSPLGNQPMHDRKNECVITFNGEIYNFKELREELSAYYEFKSQSDTEVILAGYKKWGKDVVHHLNGIFAFAIWDKDKKSLFCARDHMGVKPFYYFWDGSRFMFASEIKAILAHDIKRVLNRESFNRYMRVLYAPEPETMIQGVSKLPPGSTLYLQGRSLIVERYYTKALHTKDFAYHDAVEEVRLSIEDASARQLVSDVPVGVYLSGGIDSSVILSSVSKVKKNVKTFSIGFDLHDGEESEKFNRDFNLARETSKHFGAEHHAVTLSVTDIADSLVETIGHMDDPISNPTALSMAYLSKFARKEVTVVLSGNGGDELFGGYERYRLSVIADTLRSIPGSSVLGYMSEKAKKLLTPPGISRIQLFEFEKDAQLNTVIAPHYFSPSSSVENFFEVYSTHEKDFTDEFMLIDQKSWLPDYALLLSDKMSMKHSIEERVPLLDRKVVELSQSIPRSYKVDMFGTKKILKDAFRAELPEQLFREPKRGWFSPGAKWLRRKEVLSIVSEILSPEYYGGTKDLFNWVELEKMLQRHIDKKEYNLTILWAILTFQIWAKRYNITI